VLIKFANADLLEAKVAHRGDTLLRTAHRATFNYEPREGFLYVRSRAISSRTNDNFDTWPAAELRQAWATFIGKPVFVNHHNKDHRRARGVIIDAVLHEDTAPDGTPDTWVEVLMEVDAVRFPKLAQAILAGDIERTSMGADVGESECSYCGNVATTPDTYCIHVSRHKGQRLLRKNADGSQEDVLVHEICRKISFFENSLLVEAPADPTAFFLGVDDTGVRSMGMQAKTAARDTPSFGHPGRGPKGNPWDTYTTRRTKGGHEVVDKVSGEVLGIVWQGKDGWYGQIADGTRVIEGYSGSMGVAAGTVAREHRERTGARGGRGEQRVRSKQVGTGDHADLCSRGSSARINDDGTVTCRECGGNFPSAGEGFTPGVGTVPSHDPQERTGAQESLTADMAFACVQGGVGGDLFELHIAGCGDLSKAKYLQSTSFTFTASNWEDALDIVIDDQMQDQGYSKSDVKVFSCAKTGIAPVAPSLDPDLCPASNQAIENPQRRMRMACPACGKMLGGGRSPITKIPRHKPFVRGASKMATVEKTAWGEMKAPAVVNTLGLVECPVCGERNKFDGTGRCTVCGFLPPPEPFREPDLEVAQKVDMRDGWVNPDLMSAPAFVPPEEGDDEADPVQKDTPPNEGAERTGGIRMRPSEAIAQRQAQQIQALRAENARLRAAQGGRQRRADVNNPGQPVPEPAAQAASASTEETRSPDATADVSSGSAVLTDVGPATTTDVTSPGAAMSNVAPLANADVTAPVAGTTEMPPYADTVIKIEPDASGGTDTAPAFSGDSSWVQARKAAEAHVFASLRLARLRIRAGIESGDDLVIAEKIAATTRPEIVRTQIATLDQVVRSASVQQQRRPAPHVAQRSAPSLASMAVPGIQAVGGFAGLAVSQDEVGLFD